MNNTQILRFDLIRRIKADDPCIGNERAAQLAEQIEATGAYAHDGTRTVPIGDRAAMAAASRLAPTVAGTLITEHVAAASANSHPEAAPYDRARARLAAMGFDLDASLSGADDGPLEFMGVRLDGKGAA